MTRLSADDLESLLKAVAWISEAEVAFFAKRYPQAVSWTTIWAEIRQSYCSTAKDDGKHRSALVLCWRNNKTRKVKERVLFAGSGDCPVCTASDLLTQIRAEIPAAFGSEPAEIFIPVQLSRAYPIGLLGPYVVGTA